MLLLKRNFSPIEERIKNEKKLGKTISNEFCSYFEEKFSFGQIVRSPYHPLPGLKYFTKEFVEKYYDIFDIDTTINIWMIGKDKILNSKILSSKKGILETLIQSNYIIDKKDSQRITCEDIILTQTSIDWDPTLIAYYIEWNVESLEKCNEYSFDVSSLLHSQTSLSPEEIFRSLRNNKVSKWTGVYFYDYYETLLIFKKENIAELRRINDDPDVYVSFEFLLEWISSKDFRNGFSPVADWSSGSKKDKFDISKFIDRISHYFLVNYSKKEGSAQKNFCDEKLREIYFFILTEIYNSQNFDNESLDPFIDNKIFCDWLREGEFSQKDKVQKLFISLCKDKSIHNYIEFPFLRKNFWNIFSVIESIPTFILAKKSGLLDLTQEDLFAGVHPQEEFILETLDRKIYYLLRGYHSNPSIDFTFGLSEERLFSPSRVARAREKRLSFSDSEEYALLCESGFTFHNIFKSITTIEDFSNEVLIENTLYINRDLILRYPEIGWNYSQINSNRTKLYIDKFFNSEDNEENCSILRRALLKQEWEMIEDIYPLLSAIEEFNLPFLVLREMVVENTRKMYRNECK